MLRDLLVQLTDQVVPLIELMALVLIAFGTIEAFVKGVGTALFHRIPIDSIRAVWTRQARWLIAGLTFLLAADVLETSVSPSWDEIGQLGAIAVIRTFLSFFLERDQRELRSLLEETSTTAGNG